MVHYYCFIQTQGDLSPESRVFKVKVGESFREQAKSSLIENFASDLGWFYHVWDSSVDDRLIQASNRYRNQVRLTAFVFDTIVISVTALYKHLQDNTLDSVNPTKNYLKNRERTISITNPAASYLQKQPKNESRAYPVLRKNLSHGYDSDFYKAVAGFTCIAFLFILGALLESLERTL